MTVLTVVNTLMCLIHNCATRFILFDKLFPPTCPIRNSTFINFQKKYCLHDNKSHMFTDFYRFFYLYFQYFKCKPFCINYYCIL